MLVCGVIGCCLVSVFRFMIFFLVMNLLFGIRLGVFSVWIWCLVVMVVNIVMCRIGCRCVWMSCVSGCVMVL